MSYGFLDIASTPSVKAAQAENGAAEHWAGFKGNRAFDAFTDREIAFIAARDSFYMATTSKTGWPYLQHRGGPAGFLKVLDEKTLAFADFGGNRQYISTGNIAANNRTSLFLMDYPNRARLKIFARTEIKSLPLDPALAAKVSLPGYKAKIERVMLFHLEAFDWNCAQHITPRFTEADISEAIKPLRSHLAALEEENRSLRAKLAGVEGVTPRT